VEALYISDGRKTSSLSFASRRKNFMEKDFEKSSYSICLG
jgi:hypothetical protein